MEADLAQLAKHILKTCPRMKLQGLTTIGSLAESKKEEDGEGERGVNEDFEWLRATRDVLQALLEKDSDWKGCEWGEDGKLLLSMGMSSDFEVALKTGSDIVG